MAQNTRYQKSQFISLKVSRIRELVFLELRVGVGDGGGVGASVTCGFDGARRPVNKS